MAIKNSFRVLNYFPFNLNILNGFAIFFNVTQHADKCISCIYYPKYGNIV